MSNEITKTQYHNLPAKVIKDPLFSVIESYLSTVKTAKGNEPTQAQKENFILECVANKLNPIKKQAYLIGYDSKNGGPSFSTIVSISGFTSIASRTGDYAGVDQPVFVYDNQGQLESCSVTVYRLVKGQRFGFVGNAYYSERVQTKDEWVNNQPTGRKVPTEQWLKQPKTMLEKCARSAALRNAFPEELGNFYDEAEMPLEERQATTSNTNTVTVVSDHQIEYITGDQLNRLSIIVGKMAEVKGVSVEALIATICNSFKVATVDELTSTEAEHAINSLELKIAKAEADKQTVTVTEETEKVTA